MSDDQVRGHEMPLIDLDDHRQLIARASKGSHSRRRGTADTADGEPRVLSGADGEFQTITRDFEFAIDDDTTASPVIPRAISVSHRTTHKARRTSQKSREASPSPPTSLNAFNQHRQRTGTMASNDSIETPHHRRRLTFSEAVGADNASVSSRSTDTEAEQDVCYPQEDFPAEGPAIDFEELEEFVEGNQTAQNTPAVLPLDAEILEKPIQLPAPALGPSNDEAWAELEKVKQQQLRDDRRGSTTQVARPFYSFFTPQSQEVIHATNLGGLLNDDESFSDLFTNGDNSSWWLDVVNPTEEEVSVLCKAFSIHPLTREDITTEESRDKVEMFNHYYFVAFRSFEDDKKHEEYLEPVHWYAVVLRYGILTFSNHSTPHSKNVLKRIAKLKDYMEVSPDWIAYALIDDIVDCFMPVIEEVDQEVDQIEDNVYIARDENAREVLAQIGNSRKKIISLLRLLGGKSDVVKGFAKRCNPEYEVAPARYVGMYLSDIQDHIISMRENLSHSESLLSRIHANFLAQINIDNINAGNKTNKMLGKVTLLASILVPMNVVTGLFGMNVKVPWSGNDIDNTNAWFGILGFILGFSVLLVIVFRRLRLV